MFLQVSSVRRRSVWVTLGPARPCQGERAVASTGSSWCHGAKLGGSKRYQTVSSLRVALVRHALLQNTGTQATERSGIDRGGTSYLALKRQGWALPTLLKAALTCNDRYLPYRVWQLYEGMTLNAADELGWIRFGLLAAIVLWTVTYVLDVSPLTRLLRWGTPPD